MSTQSDAPPDLPAPDPALVLWRISTQALLTTMPKRRAERMLRVMSERLADEESLAQVFSLRPSSQHAASRRARRQAADLFQKVLPALVAALRDGE